MSLVCTFATGSVYNKEFFQREYLHVLLSVNLQILCYSYTHIYRLMQRLVKQGMWVATFRKPISETGNYSLLHPPAPRATWFFWVLQNHGNMPLPVSSFPLSSGHHITFLHGLFLLCLKEIFHKHSFLTQINFIHTALHYLQIYQHTCTHTQTSLHVYFLVNDFLH